MDRRSRSSQGFIVNSVYDVEKQIRSHRPTKMKIYKNTYVADGDITGFGYFGSKDTAAKAVTERKRECKKNGCVFEHTTFELNIEPSKAGIMEALTQHASHPCPAPAAD